MNQTLLAFSLGAAGLILAATTVHSAPPCGTRDLVLGQFTGTRDDTRHSTAVAHNNAVIPGTEDLPAKGHKI